MKNFIKILYLIQAIFSESNEMTVTVKNFQVVGYFKGKRGRQPFQFQLKGVKKEDVIEQVYSVVGSQHRVPRRKISIEEIKEI